MILVLNVGWGEYWVCSPWAAICGAVGICRVLNDEEIEGQDIHGSALGFLG